MGHDVNERNVKQLTPLHYLSRANQNFKETLNVLLDFGADVNACDVDGSNILLHCAVKGKTLDEIKLVNDVGGDLKTKRKDGTSLLHTFAAAGNPGAVKFCLEVGIDPNEKDSNGLTPLHNLSAATENFENTLKVLLDFGADINACDYKGFTVLHHCAIKRKGLNALKLVLENGGDFKIKSKHGTSLLHILVGTGNSEALKFLLELGLDISVKDSEGLTPLHILCRTTQNFENTLKVLLDFGVDINVCDDKGMNVLRHCARKHRGLNDLKLVLENGGDFKSKATDGSFILHTLARFGVSDALKFFLKLGLNPNEKDSLGFTPLHKLSLRKENFQEALMTLLDFGADINACDNEGRTVLMHCVRNQRNWHDLKLLIDKGSNCNVKSPDGSSFLQLSASVGNPDAVKYFVEIGHNPNDNLNKQKFTPLHFLSGAPKRFKRTLRAFLDVGANINACDVNGFNFLRHCATKRSLEDVKFVIEQGGDWKAKAYSGSSLLHALAQEGNHEAVKHFLQIGHAPNELTEKNKWTPLHMLSYAKTNFKETLETLLEFGADINATDVNGFTFFLLCAKNQRNIADLNFLIDKKADWQVKTLSGISLLHILSRDGNYEAIKHFLGLGMDPHLQCSKKRTALHYLSQGEKNFEQTLKLLVGCGLSVNAVDQDGLSMLMLCVMHKKTLNHIKLVVDLGGNLKAKSFDQKSLLHFAAEHGRYDLVNFLFSYGLDPNARTQTQKLTPLLSSCAATCNFEKTFQALIECGANIYVGDKDGRNVWVLGTHNRPLDQIQFVFDLWEKINRGTIFANFDKSDEAGNSNRVGGKLLHKYIFIQSTKLELNLFIEY